VKTGVRLRANETPPREPYGSERTLRFLLVYIYSLCHFVFMSFV